MSSDEGKREISSLRSAFNDTKKQLEQMGTVRREPCRQAVYVVPGARSDMIGWVQGPKDVDWSRFKDVDKPLLDLFRKSFASEPTGGCPRGMFCCHAYMHAKLTSSCTQA